MALSGATSSIISPNDKRRWSERIFEVPQINHNDCKSLVDLAAKEGGLPSENRTALDIYDVQQYLVQDDLEHISTNLMLADALTKHLSPKQVFRAYMHRIYQGPEKIF